MSEQRPFAMEAKPTDDKWTPPKELPLWRHQAEMLLRLMDLHLPGRHATAYAKLRAYADHAVNLGELDDDESAPAPVERPGA